MESIKRIYEAKVEELEGIISELEEMLERHGASIRDIYNINIAVEEIFVNIASYAYLNTENKGCQINTTFDDEGNVTIEFIDEGAEFDPLAKEDPDIKAPIEERGIGGLGIYMVKRSMDHCHYERRNGRNIFTITKRIKD